MDDDGARVLAAGAPILLGPAVEVASVEADGFRITDVEAADVDRVAMLEAFRLVGTNPPVDGFLGPAMDDPAVDWDREVIDVLRSASLGEEVALRLWILLSMFALRAVWTGKEEGAPGEAKRGSRDGPSYSSEMKYSET